MMTRVVNVRDEECDVYIGRGGRWWGPSRFGNPFKIGTHGNRDQVIERYREWIHRQPDLMILAKELKGKRLGCHCAPNPCHGDVLVEIAEEEAMTRAALEEKE